MTGKGEAYWARFYNSFSGFPSIKDCSLPDKRKSRIKILSKKRCKELEERHRKIDKIMEVLNDEGYKLKKGIYFYFIQRLVQKEGVTANLLKQCGVKDQKDIQRILIRLDAERVGESSRVEIEFEKEMNFIFMRLERGTNVHVAFVKTRPVSQNCKYSMHIRMQNHFELDRMIEMIEKYEESVYQGRKKLIGGLFYHTVVDGVHFDCVPIVTPANVEVDWAIVVKIPDCECSCEPFEKKPFIGMDWLKER